MLSVGSSTHQNNQTTSSITVTQLNQQAKFLLENQFGRVRVQGEISNLTRAASGHIYFTLKDAGAQVRCAWFKSSQGKFKPSHGDEVVASGLISLYEARGDYQLIVSSVSPNGEGQLQQKFVELKEKLLRAGLFDNERKQQLPTSINCIGVVTSDTGAAVHDILTVCKRRFPATRIIIYPVQVQGQGAARQIADAIKIANDTALCDVLIVGRGGGSIEDLWSFNEEVVALAISNSRLPVISAVGHETDFTIADFVADIRAATPSAAAELVTPDQMQIIQRIDRHEMQLSVAITRQIRQISEYLLQISSRLRHPGQRLTDQIKLLDQLRSRLNQACNNQLIQAEQRLHSLSGQLKRAHPQRSISDLSKEVSALQNRLYYGMKNQMEKKTQAYSNACSTLDAVSPLATLNRGFAIIKTSKGQTISSIKQLSKGQVIQTQMKDGSIEAKILNIQTSNTD